MILVWLVCILILIFAVGLGLVFNCLILDLGGFGVWFLSFDVGFVRQDSCGLLFSNFLFGFRGLFDLTFDLTSAWLRFCDFGFLVGWW